MYGQTQTHTQYHEHDTGQDLDSGAACATECTGLLYRAQESREEREAAEELMPLEFPPAPGKTRWSSPGWGERTNSR